MIKTGKWLLLVLGGIFLAMILYYTGAVLLARRDTPRILREAMAPDRVQLTVRDLSPWQLRALLAVEDPGFYRHHGVDLKTPGAGLTTITQGLAKQFYFHPFKPGVRKIKLMLLAWLVLDRLVSKDDQLTLFLNHVYMGRAAGRDIFGLAGAAGAYCHKPFSQLTQREYLSLVAMIIAPANFNLQSRPRANAERTRRIEDLVAGVYRPSGVMDVYYGPLDAETQTGLPQASYFPDPRAPAGKK